MTKCIWQKQAYCMVIYLSMHRAIAKGDQIHLSVVEKPTVDLYKKFEFSVSSNL